MEKSFEIDTIKHIRKYSQYPRNYLFDKNGNLSVVQFIKYNDQLGHKETYKYDNKKRMIEWDQIDNDKNEIHKISFKYEGKYKVDRYKIVNENLKLEFEYFYDNNFKLIKNIYYPYYQNTPLITEYKYDKLGRRIEELLFDNDKLIEKNVIEYDSISGYYWTHQDFEHNKIYIYYQVDDQYGNQIKMVKVDEKRNEISKDNKVYTYDNNGNWTKRIWTKDGSCHETERIIEYYK